MNSPAGSHIGVLPARQPPDCTNISGPPVAARKRSMAEHATAAHTRHFPLLPVRRNSSRPIPIARLATFRTVPAASARAERATARQHKGTAVCADPVPQRL